MSCDRRLRVLKTSCDVVFLNYHLPDAFLIFFLEQICNLFAAKCSVYIS